MEGSVDCDEESVGSCAYSQTIIVSFMAFSRFLLPLLIGLVFIGQGSLHCRQVKELVDTSDSCERAS